MDVYIHNGVLTRYIIFNIILKLKKIATRFP